jgi:hypothetical protein
MAVEQMRHGLLPTLPDGSVELYPVEFGCFRRGGAELDRVAVGELDDQSGQFEEGVGLGPGADLTGDPVDGDGFRDEIGSPPLEEGLWCGLGTVLGFAAGIPPAALVPTLAPRSATFSATGAPFGGAASWSGRTVAETAFRPRSPVGAVSATTAAGSALSPVTLVEFLDQTRRGLAGLLRPRGTEELGEVDPEGGEIGGVLGFVAHESVTLA